MHGRTFHVSHALRDDLVEDIAVLLQKARAIGMLHGQAMVEQHARSLVSAGKDLLARARQIVDGIINRIQGYIDTALDNNEDDTLSQADIIETTINDLIADMPDLVAGDAVTTEVEGAVYEVIRQSGIAQMSSVSEGDGKVCPRCQKNAEESPIDVGSSFSTGDSVPPYHENCRCNLVPA